MGRRNDHSREQQREMAIAAAELLVVKEGMDGFSMRKVARAIGYTVGQLYLIFKNQDELFVVLNERTADAIYAQLQDVMAQAASPAEAVLAAAQAYVAFAQHNPNRWRLMFEHRLPPGETAPASNIRKVERLFGLIEAQLAVDGSDGPARRELATALWSGVHGIAVLATGGKLVWSGIEDYGQLTRCLVGRMLPRSA